MSVLESPTWFGSYRLSSRIGTGGMAEVYLGRHVTQDGKFGPTVAVKRLFPHLSQQTQIVRMFLNEARITAQIDHPNVVKIIEVGQVDGEPFIAMELLDGHSFAEIRQQAAQSARRVPLGITLRILTEACRGLNAAHRAQDEQGQPLCIVHRDFTPDNIHVGVNGDVKVIDFGIAKAENLGAGTEPGTLKGKFFYMSPEMIAGKKVDHRADLFAAGVMLYEQLCGRRPFTGMATEEVLTRIAEGKPRPPSAFDPSVPLPLETICLTALARNPDQRFPGLQEFVDAIAAVGGNAEIASKEELAAYMAQLFPVDLDPKRQTLRRAMQADPSVSRAPGASGSRPGIRMGTSGSRPGVRPGTSPGARASEQPPDAPTSVVVDADPAATIVVPSSPGMTAAEIAAKAITLEPTKIKPVSTFTPTVEERAVPAPRSVEVADDLEPRRSGFRWGYALLVLVLAGAVAGVVVGRDRLFPRRSVAERLQLAEATLSADGRASQLEALAEDASAKPEELVKAGELLLGASAYRSALGLAEGFGRRFPADASAPLLEARASIGLRLGKRAEAAISRARSLAPDDVRADLVLSELRQAQGDASGAIEALANARKRKPQDLELMKQQGVLLSQANRLDEAADVLGSALQKRPDADTAAELAFVRFRQDQLEQSLSLLKQALKKNPKLFKAHYYLGAVLFRQGDTKGAERAYRDADAVAQPNDPRALTALCELQAKSADPKAVEATQKLLQARFPEQAATLLAECKP